MSIGLPAFGDAATRLSEAVIEEARRRQRRRRRVVALMAAGLVAAGASGWLARGGGPPGSGGPQAQPAPAAANVAPLASPAPPLRLQTARKCVAIWNRYSPEAGRAIVARFHPIYALVVGLPVSPTGGTATCSVLLMMNNGSWYSTQTPCAPGAIEWTPLKRAPADAGSRYSTGRPFSSEAIVRADGTMRLA
jgi:hypothetical protein